MQFEHLKSKPMIFKFLTALSTGPKDAEYLFKNIYNLDYHNISGDQYLSKRQSIDKLAYRCRTMGFKVYRDRQNDAWELIGG